MAATNPPRKRRPKGAKQEIDKYGARAELIDRRRRVWALRAQGYSLREIGRQLDVSPWAVWRDCQRATEDWGSIVDDTGAIQQQLLAIHQLATGHLIRDLEQQATNGQRVTQLDADGQVLSTQVRSWLNPQTAAELGRTLERIARLMGLQDGTTADSSAPGTAITNIVLTSPSDGGSFEQWASAAAAAPEPAAIEVSAAPAHESTRAPSH